MTPDLCAALLLLHSQDSGLRAGGHALLGLLEGRSQPHVPADEAHHVVDESVDAQRAAQVQVGLLVRVGGAVAALAAQLGSEPGLGQRVRRAVEETCRRREKEKTFRLRKRRTLQVEVALSTQRSAV